MSGERKKIRIVRCPICGKRTKWDGNPYRPFCSERCKLIDLGNWLDEIYVIHGDKGESEKEGS